MSSAALTELPAVAKRIPTDCKKCGGEKYHIVLAHKTATSAQVQCEVCGSKKTFKLAKPAKKVPFGTPVKKPRATTAAARKNAHEAEFNTLMEAQGDSDVVKYNMKTKFATNQKLEHPKFGVGIIRMSLDEKIEVVFPDEVRLLVHNRT